MSPSPLPLWNLKLLYRNVKTNANLCDECSLGIGAPLPEKAADGSWNRKELSSNDILRKQLLGRNYDKVMKAKEAEVKAQREKNAAAAAQAAASGSGSGSAPTASAADDDDDDEEEGRAAMVGKRRKTNSNSNPSSRMVPVSSASTTAENGAAGAGADGDAQSADQSSVPSGKKSGSARRKKATSYLDEILAQRANKKKKR